MNIVKQLKFWYWNTFINKWKYQDNEGNIISEKEFHKKLFNNILFPGTNRFIINTKTKTIQLYEH